MILEETVFIVCLFCKCDTAPWCTKDHTPGGAVQCQWALKHEIGVNTNFEFFMSDWLVLVSYSLIKKHITKKFFVFSWAGTYKWPFHAFRLYEWAENDWNPSSEVMPLFSAEPDLKLDLLFLWLLLNVMGRMASRMWWWGLCEGALKLQYQILSFENVFCVHSIPHVGRVIHTVCACWRMFQNVNDVDYVRARTCADGKCRLRSGARPLMPLLL